MTNEPQLHSRPPAPAWAGPPAEADGPDRGPRQPLHHALHQARRERVWRERRADVLAVLSLLAILAAVLVVVPA